MSKSLIQSSYIVHQKRELFTFSSIGQQRLAFSAKDKNRQVVKKIVYTISGGQDSILLFFLLLHAKKTWNLTLHVVYCHHFWQIQNLYVFREIWKLAFLYYIPSSYFFSSNQQQTEQKASLWRQDSYCRAAEVFSCENITLAHTASDGIETALWHIGRGTSPRGIVNMRPKRLYNPRQYNRISFAKRVIKKYCAKKISNNKIIKTESQIKWLQTISVNQKMHNTFKQNSFSLVFFNSNKGQVFEKRHAIKEYHRFYKYFSCGQFDVHVLLQNRTLVFVSNGLAFSTKDKNVLKKEYTRVNSDNFQLTKTLYYCNRDLNTIFYYLLNRPLSNFHRSDVNFLVHQNNLPLIPDDTNKNIIFTRNRIRVKLIPTLRYFLNTEFDRHLWSYLEITNIRQEFLDNIIESILEGYCNTPKSIKNIKELSRVILLECLYQLLKAYTSRQITIHHITKFQYFLDLSDLRSVGPHQENEPEILA